MKVRILRPCSGDVDGIPLEQFVSGRVYDVSAALATYLLVERLAAAESEAEPAPVVPRTQLESDRSGSPRQRKTARRRHSSNKAR
jgi:hypothetical protein